MIKNPVRYFNKKPVRAIWDSEKSSWWYSATDLIDILVEPNSPRRYWSNVKIRNPELSPFCGQQKLLANDNKQYFSEVINENGIKLLTNIIPSKYRKQVLDWINGSMVPIDEQSRRKAYQLYKTNLINDDEIGKTISLQKIHAYLFEGLYEFAGKIRTRTISKGGFVFANGDYLPQTLSQIDKMPQSTFDEIVEKYVEMNIAHPFMEGNGRATRIWLDLIFNKELKKCIDWSSIDKKDYFDAMMVNPNDDSKIKDVLKSALTDDIDNRELFLKGIDTSYYYEEVE